MIVGLDLGGTDIKRGATSRDGVPLSDTTLLEKLPSRVKEGPGATLEQFRIGIYRLQQNYQSDILAIGLASAGPANKEGQIQESTNYGPLWNYFELRRAVEEEFGIRTIYENDANAAALAEQQFLLAKSPEYKGLPGLFITVGTGLGGGVINSSGELDRGANGLAGEVGHIPMRRPISSVDLFEEGVPCGCKQIGCAEQYTSLSFIERELMYALREASTHPLRSIVDPREAAKQVLRCAGENDPLCLAIIYNQARNVGRFLGEQIIDKDPAWVFIGGGVTEAVPTIREGYLAHVKEEIRSRIGDRSFSTRLIDYASLGDNAGWLGAAISAAGVLAE